tara:strand:+ start:1019 stop:1183 length:165 start_codon:yes stop_codon:yes gene_type:complete
MEEIIKELEWYLDCESDRLKEGHYLSVAEQEEGTVELIKGMRRTLAKFKKGGES